MQDPEFGEKGPSAWREDDHHLREGPSVWWRLGVQRQRLGPCRARVEFPVMRGLWLHWGECFRGGGPGPQGRYLTLRLSMNWC